MSILVAILIFEALIAFHEFGHFLAAKAGGVVVEEFCLGFGPKLLGFERGGTKYGLRIVPLGGFCLMKGEDSDCMEEGSFASRPVWIRALIVAAGPLFNFLLAFVLSMVLIGSVGYDAPAALSVREGYPAAEAGMTAGDQITRLGNKRIRLYRQVSDYVTYHQREMASGEPMVLEFTHEGETVRTTIIPKDDGNGRYVLGITGNSNLRVKGGPAEVVRYAFVEVGYWIETVFSSLKMIFTGGVTMNDISGPVGVVSAIGETYEESRSDGAFYVVINMIGIAILLSANLGVMNLLPLPALDGGRLLFILVEAVRRKRLDPETEGKIHLAGFALLLALMLLVCLNDVRRLF